MMKIEVPVNVVIFTYTQIKKKYLFLILTVKSFLYFTGWQSLFLKFSFTLTSIGMTTNLRPTPSTQKNHKVGEREEYFS